MRLTSNHETIRGRHTNGRRASNTQSFYGFPDLLDRATGDFSKLLGQQSLIDQAQSPRSTSLPPQGVIRRRH
jgi:hypothetical protein